MVNILTVSSPKYSRADNSAIDCLCTFDHIEGEHWYTSAAHDPEPHGQQLWAELIAGEHGEVAAYVAPTLTPVQQAYAAIARGIILTSTGTPSLNGTYPADPSAQVKLNSAITYIMVTGAFPPASAVSMPWYDSDGVSHVFTSIDTFKAFATAFADFVAHVDIYASSNGGTGSIPSNSITIP